MKAVRAGSIAIDTQTDPQTASAQSMAVQAGSLVVNVGQMQLSATGFGVTPTQPPTSDGGTNR